MIEINKKNNSLDKLAVARYNFGENISASEYLLQQMEVFMRGIYRNFKQKPSVNNVDIDYKVIFACDSDDNTYWRSSLFPDYIQNRPMTQIRQTVRDSIVLFLKKRKTFLIYSALRKEIPID